jgi:hypothetical protein
MYESWSHLVESNARLLARVLRAVADELDSTRPEPPAVAFPVLFIDGRELAVGSITVSDSADPLTATVTFKDAKGYETQPSGTPEWSSSDDSVASVEASDDGLSAEITVGAPGAAVIEVSEVDERGEEIISQGTITVQPGDAEIGEVDFESPAGSAQPPEPVQPPEPEPVSPESPGVREPVSPDQPAAPAEPSGTFDQPPLPEQAEPGDAPVEPPREQNP